MRRHQPSGKKHTFPHSFAQYITPTTLIIALLGTENLIRSPLPRARHVSSKLPRHYSTRVRQLILWEFHGMIYDLLGWQLGSDPEIQVASPVSNHLTSGVLKYFGSSGRYAPAVNLFERMYVREPEVASLLATSYIGMSAWRPR